MSKNVLIIEDSGSFRMVVKVALERAGYEITEAANAEEACALLDGRSIHVVVCDLNMPGMNGIEFVRHLRSTNYKFTPVVMLTTDSQVERKAEAADMGVRVWITKPFQPTYLIEAVSKLCPI
ncbi:MAG: response regulator [Aquabacterium sp.]|uniref:response regulator n=1 Tax=Aquabacterium sp. TaxID=1872578 RepID=UPI0025BEDB53|nr:response regulator [Aquabacterium sp.]MBI5926571.1 response regulator [Aquabacterium sp.]